MPTNDSRFGHTPVDNGDDTNQGQVRGRAVHWSATGSLANTEWVAFALMDGVAGGPAHGGGIGWAAPPGNNERSAAKRTLERPRSPPIGAIGTGRC